jgi:hypothetical protein
MYSPYDKEFSSLELIKKVVDIAISMNLGRRGCIERVLFDRELFGIEPHKITSVQTGRENLSSCEKKLPAICLDGRWYCQQDFEGQILFPVSRLDYEKFIEKNVTSFKVIRALPTGYFPVEDQSVPTYKRFVCFEAGVREFSCVQNVLESLAEKDVVTYSKWYNNYYTGLSHYKPVLGVDNFGRLVISASDQFFTQDDNGFYMEIPRPAEWCRAYPKSIPAENREAPFPNLDCLLGF